MGFVVLVELVLVLFEVTGVGLEDLLALGLAVLTGLEEALVFVGEDTHLSFLSLPAFMQV